DTVVDAAKTSAEGVRTLAGDAANSIAKAATGTVLSAVKGARRLVRGKSAKRAVKKRAKTSARRKTAAVKRGAKRAVKKTRRASTRTVARKRTAARKKK